MSHTEIGRIEHATSPRIPFEAIAVVGAVLGLDVSLRAYPDGEPVRDAAQIALLARLRLLLPPAVSWETEVPIRAAGDRRAWDAVIGGPGWRVPVDAETRLRDVQACSRKVALKRRDDRSDIVILLVADTRHNRHVLRLARADLAAEFPVAGEAVLASVVSGQMPSGSGIVLL